MRATSLVAPIALGGSVGLGVGLGFGLGACAGDAAAPAVDAPGGASDARGGADAATIDAAGDAAPAGSFALTSPTITDGGTIPLAHVCAGRGGMNRSPALAFADPPAGTLSYAVVLTDKTNGLVHSAIYDIPGTATGLPADVDKVYAPPDVASAHQTASYDSAVRGYNGPCPPAVHTYELRAYAVTSATLPGATMATTKEQVVSILATASAGSATLTATFTP